MSDDLMQERGEYPSASSVARYKKCKVSYLMERLAVEQGQVLPADEYAIYGTEMHTAMQFNRPAPHWDEHKLMDYSKLKRKRENFLISWGAKESDTVYCERRLWLHEGLWPVFSGQSDHLRIQGKRALIMDFKSLWARAQEPAENDQLLALAILVWAHFDQVEEITVQLLSPHYDYFAHTHTNEALKKHEAELWHLLKEIKQVSDPVPSDQCKYCKAKLICPAIKKEGAAILKGTRMMPGGEAGARLMSEITRLKVFIKEAEEFYKLKVHEDPLFLPGYALVAGDTRRVVKSPHKAYVGFAPDLGTEAFFGTVEVSVTKLEAAWNKARVQHPELVAFAEFAKDFISVKQNRPSLEKIGRKKQKELAEARELLESKETKNKK